MDSIFKAVNFKKSPMRGSASTKHKKLPENWGQHKEPVREGITFYVKYLGSTLVEELEEEGKSYGDSISSEAVNTIVAMARASGKKLLKMAISISPNHIQVTNTDNNEILTDMSIYRICFCTADRYHDKVFAYIARSVENETMECHAFLCQKRKVAQAVTLTVAQAFSIAKEDWDKREHMSPVHMTEASVNNSKEQSAPQTKSNIPSMCSPHVISQAQVESPRPADDFFDSEFERFAECRSKGLNPFSQCNFSTGLRPEEIDDGLMDFVKGQNKHDELNREPSIDDLMSL